MVLSFIPLKDDHTLPDLLSLLILQLCSIQHAGQRIKPFSLLVIGPSEQVVNNHCFLNKAPRSPVGGISAPLRPRLSGFPFHSNKLRDIQRRRRNEFGASIFLASLPIPRILFSEGIGFMELYPFLYNIHIWSYAETI